jgi:integrase
MSTARRPKRPRGPMNIWKRGRSYYLEFRWKGIRYGPKSLGPISRDAAERQAADMRLAVMEGRYHAKPSPVFENYAAEFLTWYRSGRRPQSIQNYRRIVRRLAILWRGRSLDMITTLDIERVKRDRAQVCKANTVNLDLEVINHLFNQAVRWDLLRVNPAAPVKRLRVDEPTTRVLTPHEASALLGSCGAHLRPVVLFALATGLRLDELTTLRWRQIDWIRKVVTIESVSAKSRRSRRIPLAPSAQVVLEALRRPDHDPDARVFGYRDWRSSFQLAARRAGMTDIHPHTLRHTVASQWLEAKINIRSVQRWLGHSTLQQTIRYTHPSAVHDREEMERFDREMGQSTQHPVHTDSSNG